MFLKNKKRKNMATFIFSLSLRQSENYSELLNIQHTEVYVLI